MPEILEEGHGMLRFHVGNATHGDEEMDLAYSMNGAPVVSFKDGPTIYWTWEELIDQALEIKEKGG